MYDTVNVNILVGNQEPFYFNQLTPHMATHVSADCHYTFCWYFHQATTAQLCDPVEDLPSATNLSTETSHV